MNISTIRILHVPPTCDYGDIFERGVMKTYFTFLCQNSLKSNNGLSRIIYISLNGLCGGYLKTIAFILAGNVEYRN